MTDAYLCTRFHRHLHPVTVHLLFVIQEGSYFLLSSAVKGRKDRCLWQAKAGDEMQAAGNYHQSRRLPTVLHYRLGGSELHQQKIYQIWLSKLYWTDIPLRRHSILTAKR